MPQERPIKFNDWFLGIGIGEYTTFPRLRNPVRDIFAVRKVLSKEYGFLDDRIQLLQDENATKINIISAIESYEDRLGENDRLIIYFSGHGKLNKKIGYWIPYEGQEGQKITWISQNDLQNTLTDLEKCQQILVISDSCFSASILINNKNIPDAFLEVYKSRTRFGLASGLDYVSDGDENSPFAKGLIHVLESNTSYLTTASLKAGISQYLVANGVNQVPISGYISGLGEMEYGDFVFFSKNKVNTESKMAFDYAEQSNSLDAWHSFLSTYGSSPYFKKANEEFNLLALAELSRLFGAKDLDGLKEFKIKYPFDHLVKQADNYLLEIELEQRRLTEKIAYEWAVQQNTTEAFRNFIEQHPGAEKVPDVRKLLQDAADQASVEELLETKTLKELETLLSKRTYQFLNSHASINAHRRKLSFEQLLNSKSTEEVTSYMEESKDWLSSEQIRQLEDVLKKLKEYELYKDLGHRSSIHDFYLYFKSYPESGQYYESAKNRLLNFVRQKMMKGLESVIKQSYESGTAIKKVESVFISQRGSEVISLADKSYMRQIESLSVWQNYRKELGIEENRKSWDDCKNIQENFAYFKEHFPIALKESGLGHQIDRRLLQNEFHQQSELNSIAAYQAFWQSDKWPELAQPASAPKPWRKIALALLAIGLLLGGWWSYRELDINKGEELYWAGDYEQAYQTLIKYKDSNHGKALHFLNGAGYEVNGDSVTACARLERALELGFYRSYFIAGRNRINDTWLCDMPIDTAKSLEYLHTAAEMGEERAMELLGYAYRNGLGDYLKKNYAIARTYYESAARLGNIDAQLYLGDQHYEKDGWLKQDFKKAYPWYRMAALNGHTTAQIQLGNIWSEIGEGEVDESRKLYWYREAEKKGSPWAIRNIGNHFFSKNKLDSAFVYYHRAAQWQDNIAQYELSKFYKNGDIVEANLDSMLYWMKQSSARGYSVPSFQLGKYYLEEDALKKPKNPDSAYHYLLIARQQGHSNAAYYLGEIHNRQLIDSVSEKQAMTYYAEADGEDVLDATNLLAAYYMKKGNYLQAGKLYEKLVSEIYPLDSIGMYNLVKLIASDTAYMAHHYTLNYLGKAVDAGNQEAEIPFFKTKYQRFIGRRRIKNLQTSGANYRKITLSEKQLTALENYQYSKESGIITLAAFFLENEATKRFGCDFAFEIDDSLSIALLQRAADLNNPFAMIKLGEFYNRNEDGDKAVETYQGVLGNPQANDNLQLDILLRMGKITLDATYEIDSDYSKPIEYFKRALKIDPENKTANSNLCQIYYDNDQFGKADNYCVKAMLLGDEQAKQNCIDKGWYTPPPELTLFEKIKKGLFK